MENRLSLVRGSKSDSREIKPLSAEEGFRHLRNVMNSLLEDAQKTWGEMWMEFQGHLVEGYAILPGAKGGFTPPSGWPEFLEKMWILKHHLDHARAFSEGKIEG